MHIFRQSTKAIGKGRVLKREWGGPVTPPSSPSREPLDPEQPPSKKRDAKPSPQKQTGMKDYYREKACKDIMCYKYVSYHLNYITPIGNANIIHVHVFKICFCHRGETLAKINTG